MQGTVEKTAILAMVMLTNTAPVVGPVAPAIVYDFTERFHLSIVQASNLVSAQLAGITAATIACYWLITRFDRRVLAGLAIFLALAGELATLTTASFHPLIGFRFIAGFGEGAAFSVAIAALGGTAEADRNISFSVASNSIVVTLILTSVVFFGFGVGAGRTMVAFVLLLLVMGLGVPWLPRRGATAGAAAAVRVAPAHSAAAAFIALLGVFLMSTSFGTVWPLIGKIGLQRHDSHHTIATAFALVGLGAIAAGFAAAWISGRLARPVLMAIGTLGFAGSIAALVLPLPFAVIALAAIFFWTFGVPFYFGHVASLDPTGRAVVLTGAMVPAGIAAGQLVAAALSSLPGFGWIVGVGVVLAVAALTALLTALQVKGGMRRQVSTA